MEIVSIIIDNIIIRANMKFLNSWKKILLSVVLNGNFLVLNDNFFVRNQYET